MDQGRFRGFSGASGDRRKIRDGLNSGVFWRFRNGHEVPECM